MSKTARHKATQEAKRDLTTHPERPTPHQDAIGRYLSALAYRDRPVPEEERTERDEPPDRPAGR